MLSVVERKEHLRLINIAARWEAMCSLLDGEEVSDFMLSYPEIEKLDDIIAVGRKRKSLVSS